MAAPINYGQIQAALLHGIWFMDMIGSQDKRREILATIKAELDAAEQAKADLAAGQAFLTALNRMKDEIETAGSELEATQDGIALAKADAEEIRAKARVELKGLAARAEELDKFSADLVGRRNGLDEREKGLNTKAAGMTILGASQEIASEDLDARAAKLDTEAERLRGIKTQLEAAGKIKI